MSLDAEASNAQSSASHTPENDATGSFWGADVEEAARRLATILTDEQADVLTIYDDHGTYGHPDHIQVHRVGVRAAELAGTPRVYEARKGQPYRRAAGPKAVDSCRSRIPWFLTCRA